MTALQKNNYEFYDNYKTIIKFMKGLQLAERIEENDKEINIRKAETDTHFIYHFVMPIEEKSRYSWDDEKYTYASTFGIYCHKEKFQVVVKSSMMYSSSNGTGHMLTNNLTSLLYKKNFRNIKYDLKRVRGNVQYPQIFVKVLVGQNDFLGNIHELYETMKEYNNVLHPKWMADNPW